MIPAKNSIEMYFHCSECLKEKPKDQSPQDYRRYDVGFTTRGIQVWCCRHELNIVHIDFEGHKHPANMQPRDPH